MSAVVTHEPRIPPPADPAEAYEVLELIGRGSFGQIRKVRRKSDSLILVRKEISYHRMSEKEKAQLQAEFRILEGAQHPNIVRYFHRVHIPSDSMLHLYMEYCGNGDLGGIINKCRRERTMVPEHAVWSIFTQLVLALYRCHNGVDPPEYGDIWSTHTPSLQPQYKRGENPRRILHRDLKPENVFLGQDNDVKLGDFGLAKMLAPEQHLANTYVGTPYYMSPEIVSDQPYTHKSDIWSLGCIIYELCKLAPPFDAKTQWSLIEKIKIGRYEPMPNQYSPILRAIVDSCLKLDHTKRPDTAELLTMDMFRLTRRERDAVNLNRAIRAREESLRRKEQILESEKKEFLKGLETKQAVYKESLDKQLRAEWEVKALAEINRQVEMQVQQRVEVEVSARLETEVNARLETEVNARLETDVNARLEAEVNARLEGELERRINELDLVPRHMLLTSSLNSTLSGSSDGSSGAPSDLSAGALYGYKETPSKLFSHRLVPDSPADIMMASPSAYTSPGLRYNILSQEPPRMPLNPMALPNRPILLHQSTEPAICDPVIRPSTPPRAHSTSAQGFTYGVPPEPPVAQMHTRRVATFNGSPVQISQGAVPKIRAGLSRAGTDGCLFGFADKSARYGLEGKENTADDLKLVETGRPVVRANARSLADIARQQRNRQIYGEVATYDPNTEPIPSPFKK